MADVARGTLLLDSNYLIGIVNGTIPFKPVQSLRYAISAVPVMELWALAGMSSAEEERIDGALELMEIVPITAAIAKRAGLLARTHRRGKADLLIAATALELGMPLATRNTRDFKRIPGLKLIPDLY